MLFQLEPDRRPHAPRSEGCSELDMILRHKTRSEADIDTEHGARRLSSQMQVVAKLLSNRRVPGEIGNHG